jgi:hypothetical protein
MQIGPIDRKRSDGPIWEEKRRLSLSERKVRYFVKIGLSRQAARALAALGRESADDVLGLQSADLRARKNSGRVASTELSAFA